MAFEELGGEGELSEEIKAENAEKGELMTLRKEPVEGIYRGFNEVSGFEGKGKQRSHKFEAKDGSIFKIRGFGLMDHIIANEVTEGQLIRVTYTGKGDDGYHKCKVAVDNGDKTSSASSEEL